MATPGHRLVPFTLSFNHDIVDGAQAARFIKRFGEVLAGGEPLRSANPAT